MRTFFVLMFLIMAMPAFAGIPIVNVHYDPGKIEYRHQDEEMICGDSSTAVGCTRPSYKTPEITVKKEKNGKTVIDMYIGFRHFLIDIVTKYQPDSCEFDQIIKHELTHVALFRKTMEKYKPYMAAEILAAIGDDSNLEIQEIKNRARMALSRIYQNYSKEAKRQNALLDGDEHYSYQWKYCSEKRRQEMMKEIEKQRKERQEAEEKQRKERQEAEEKQRKELAERREKIQEDIEKGKRERAQKRLEILQKFVQNEIEEGDAEFEDEYGYLHKISLKKKAGLAMCSERIVTDLFPVHETSVMPVQTGESEMPFGGIFSSGGVLPF